MRKVSVSVGDDLGAYGFPHGHPFGPDRMMAFRRELERQALDRSVVLLEPSAASRDVIERFHSADYVDLVERLSERGSGLLDGGDTPAFAGCYEAAATVVGTAVDALAAIMASRVERAFVPIAGLHHARRDSAGGFCIFNDCGVVIETLRSEYGVRRVAYVDIDAHHGDGVFYAFEDDPDLTIVDLHQDGRFLYPGTGFAEETGRGPAEGTKLNVPLFPGSGDEAFRAGWERGEALLEAAAPEFILVQCGADSVAGDPLAQLMLSRSVHAEVVRSVGRIADRHASGRVLAVGGGGYDRDNLAVVWCSVVAALLEDEAAGS